MKFDPDKFYLCDGCLAPYKGTDAARINMAIELRVAEATEPFVAMDWVNVGCDFPECRGLWNWIEVGALILRPTIDHCVTFHYRPSRWYNLPNKHRIKSIRAVCECGLQSRVALVTRKIPPFEAERRCLSDLKAFHIYRQQQQELANVRNT